jgi:Protein of unknown function (DUF2934)
MRLRLATSVIRARYAPNTRLRSKGKFSVIYVRYRTDKSRILSVDNARAGIPLRLDNQGNTTMATQVDPATQPDKSRTNLIARNSQVAQPRIIPSTVTKTVRPVVEPLNDTQRRELIAVTAYYLAERRSFEPGHEEEDWLEAEAQVGSLGAIVS